MSVTTGFIIFFPDGLPYFVGPKVFSALAKPIFVLVCSIEPLSYQPWFLTYTAKHTGNQGLCSHPFPCQC